MNAGAGEMDDPTTRPACEVTAGPKRLHPVVGPKRQRRMLGGPRAVLGVEKLHEPIRLLVREFLRHLRDPVQQLVVGHSVLSLPGITVPMPDAGLSALAGVRGAGEGTDESSGSASAFSTSVPPRGYGGRGTPKR